jgi:hypothetical protein
VTFPIILAALLAIQEPGVVAVVAPADLTGRTVAHAAGLLGATRDPAPAITLVEDGNRIDIYPADEFFSPTPGGLRCGARLLPPELLASAGESRAPLFASDRSRLRYRRVADVYLVARDGVVVSIIAPPVPEPAPAPPGESPREQARRVMQENRDAWLSVAPGRLPLSDGAGFLERRADLAAPANASLARLCERGLVQMSPAPADRDDSGPLQGGALLPFAWRLHGLNTEGDGSRLEGARLLGALQPGEDLPGGVDAFLSAHPRVRRHSDEQDPAYSVLAFTLGAEVGDSPALMTAAVLIGVRQDTIIWIADGEAAAGLGLTAALCIDELAVAGPLRPGCSTTGYFSP